MGKNDEALSFYQQALAIREKRFGSQHADTITTQAAIKELKVKM